MSSPARAIPPTAPRTASPPAARQVPRRAARPSERASAPAPRLEVLEVQGRPGRRLPVAVFCAAVMLATLMAVLLVNIALSRGSYESHELAQRRTTLVEQEQALSEELAAAAAPGALADRARALGMVPSTDPGFVRLSDGTVTGEPEPAAADAPAPSPSPSPSATD